MRKLMFVFMMAFMTVYGKEEVPPALLQLLQVMEVSHDGTLRSIVDATQARWIRPAGKERWEIADLPAEKKERVIDLAEELGFFGEIVPKHGEFDYALVLGATVFRMQKRIETLIRLWDAGVRFHQIVFLTGQRPLDPSVEALTEICDTESEAAEVLWRLAPVSEDMGLVPVTFVSAPMFSTAAGIRRPTTGDSIDSWLHSGPKPGRCLFISSQPYCLYQDAVVQMRLPAEFKAETVGDGTNGRKQNAAVVLDTIARWLYQQELKKS